MYKRFKALLKERQITLKILIPKLDLSESAIYAWKRGKLPNTENLIKIADYFDVSVDYLIGRTDDRKIAGYSKPLSTPTLELIHKIETANYRDGQVKIISKLIDYAENFDEGEDGQQ